MDGVIVVNKPKNYTSHDVVAIIRKVLNKKKVGHIGTLDPNATGVLPILVGKATKISKYLIEHNKTYIATLKLGEKKDTGDETGKTLEHKEVGKYNEEEVINVLNAFKGESMQIPPLYSAIKVNGKKLYEYARKGEEIKVEPRKINVFDINLIKLNNEKQEITFEANVSKGTYIRTLCEDIAKRLGTIGYMKYLIRTSVDEFTINSAIELEDLNLENMEKKIISIENIFMENKKIDLNNRDLELFLNGVMLTKKNDDGVYRIYSKQVFIGLGIIKNNLLKRDVIIFSNE